MFFYSTAWNSNIYMQARIKFRSITLNCEVYKRGRVLLLGIYIYLHKVRSSRDLQKACEVNVELWWLVHEHKPSYKTIANFRKDNNASFKKLFRVFRDFCKSSSSTAEVQ